MRTILEVGEDDSSAETEEESKFEDDNISMSAESQAQEDVYLSQLDQINVFKKYRPKPMKQQNFRMN
jgi:hypothetical protein